MAKLELEAEIEELTLEAQDLGRNGRFEDADLVCVLRDQLIESLSQVNQESNPSL